jgi:hypothetical protein
MKITAIIPDEIIADVQKYTGGKNITDSLIKALNDWLYTRRLKDLDQMLVEEPLEFKEGYSASRVRKLSKRE